MARTDKERPSHESDDLDRTSTKVLPVAAFTGYRSFPAVMNLYANYSGILEAMTTLKLCGASASDVLYIAQVHVGWTPRGPLHFGRGIYLRNGTSLKDSILAATGEVFRLPLFLSLFDSKTSLLRASITKEQAVAFRFTIEVGTKRIQREEFEWRKSNGKETGAREKGARYELHPLAATLSALASSYSSSPPEDGSNILAELTLDNVLSFKHLFTLKLMGPGLTGEMGDRWTLMVVMTALRIHWLRQNGKTNKPTVAAAQLFDSN
ncbi:hypothetical protein C7999DRAFT_44056 [Corynascus novoguineensis]|uniref:Uncharacterized protein n=1 Tax=Corynascus novoguineensis TaxID=1126955 RepID=A0AAN7CMB5_9PEZI|nr:hypothetical protein C7999DRAFT_44056 [Corynascus novoguineensis]